MEDETLIEIVKSLQKYIVEYEKLCELHYRIPFVEADRKIAVERQMRLLRLNYIYPAKHKLADIVDQMMRDAQDRAWARVKDNKRN